jgi:hypothetical protein
VLSEEIAMQAGIGRFPAFSDPVPKKPVPLLLPSMQALCNFYSTKFSQIA